MVSPVTCPACGSPDTQSFEMAYMTATKTNTLGGSFGRSQSLLAERVRPPRQPPSQSLPYVIIGAVLGAGLGVAIVPLVFPMGTREEIYMLPASILFVLGIVAGALYGAPQDRRKREEFVAQMDAWHRAWICLRCGNSRDRA